MTTCNVCGEPIVFRYVDGRPTPIHINGHWCRGYRETKTPRESGPFRTIQSYVNPNAICPVCDKIVFFYQSPRGGRVFFDDLGWPWPKHPCTDNKQKVRKPARQDRGGSVYIFRASDGSQLALYDLDAIEQHDTNYKFVFRSHDTRKLRTGILRAKELSDAGLDLSDFGDAPSFFIDLDKSNANGLTVDFICSRLGKIVRIRMSKEGL